MPCVTSSSHSRTAPVKTPLPVVLLWLPMQRLSGAPHRYSQRWGDDMSEELVQILIEIAINQLAIGRGRRFRL